MKRAALVFSMVLGACMPASNDDVTTRQNSSVYSDFVTNPFPVSPSRKVTASNKDIARDFMDCMVNKHQYLAVIHIMMILITG